MTDVVSHVTLQDLEKLEGYIEEPTKSPYEVKRLRNKDHLLILYTTGKLVVQGRNSPFAADEKTTPSTTESIGSDETLKGDTFGGLIVCAAYFKQGEIELRDSKLYTDDAIILKAKELLEQYPERFAVQKLSPKEYNQLYAELGSQTSLLNELHRQVAQELQQHYKVLHVVDQYPGCQVGDIAVPKAESSYTSVAAASIVARYHALQQFQELSAKAGIILPKGSTHVKEAVFYVRKNKLPIDEFCKMHFSTVTP